MAKSRLHQVQELGQSIWCDYIRRAMLVDGELRRLMEEDAVTGVTANPTIFEKAIAGSKDYDDALRDLVASGADVDAIYEGLAIQDIRMAADILRPVYDRTDGRDGFVSIEVSPLLANDTQSTIAEARRFFRTIERPNVLIKIPATAEGIPAIEQCLYEGININITLIFALEVYEQVMEAYLRALERRAAEGLPIDRIASVASFFVSRVDTEVDQRLEARIRDTRDPAAQEQLRALQGRAAVANARLAYQRFRQIFGGPRFAALAAKGARVQRPLWASTSTKNPAYRDVMYVEELIGPDTVNTLPPQTIVAFQDHGVVRRTVDTAVDEARAIMERLQAAGVDMGDVTWKLQVAGVKAFADSFQQLLASIKSRRDALLASGVGRQHFSVGAARGALDDTLDGLGRDNVCARLWAHDPSLWSGDSTVQATIRNRLGWLTVVDTMQERLDELAELAGEVRAAGIQRVLLLGMGGSSLAPEVLYESFGAAAGYPDLRVVDTTDPSAIAAFDADADPARTLFIVASKSGTTIEVSSLFAHEWQRTASAVGAEAAGRHFVAITDPGTPLEKLGRERGFRRVFLNPPDIGGRYSALSYFGLVPAALIGVDVGRLLDRADRMVNACASTIAARDNPGLWLGAVLGSMARQGHDKLTLVVPRPIGTFGYWVEQLIAESTGKQGTGIVPVEGEPLGEPGVYGEDRLFVALRLASTPDVASDRALSALEAAGQPVVRLTIGDTYDLGGEFFRWELATAVAGRLLGINPFDEPNVQESKDNTRRLLAELQQRGALPEPPASYRGEGIQAVDAAGGEAASLERLIDRLLAGLRPGDYLAILAYLPRSPGHELALQGLRLRLRDAFKVATTLGYGPRYLHSTGQLHKGGRDNGVFLQIVGNDDRDLAIPGQPYSFGMLKQAQALGDYQALARRGRRVLRVRLDDVEAGLKRLVEATESAVGARAG